MLYLFNYIGVIGIWPCIYLILVEKFREGWSKINQERPQYYDWPSGFAGAYLTLYFLNLLIFVM